MTDPTGNALRANASAEITGATKRPWGWTVHDASMATLHGPDEMFDHVLSHGPCKNCQKDQTEWEWGRCMTVSQADAALIVTAVNERESLLASLASERAVMEQMAVALRAARPWIAKSHDSVAGLSSEAAAPAAALLLQIDAALSALEKGK